MKLFQKMKATMSLDQVERELNEENESNKKCFSVSLVQRIVPHMVFGRAR